MPPQITSTRPATVTSKQSDHTTAYLLEEAGRASLVTLLPYFILQFKAPINTLRLWAVAVST
jgi:hypothetical protein